MFRGRNQNDFWPRVGRVGAGTGSSRDELEGAAGVGAGKGSSRDELADATGVGACLLASRRP